MGLGMNCEAGAVTPCIFDRFQRVEIVGKFT